MWLGYKHNTQSIWVPLRRVDWTWSGSASDNDGTWELNEETHSVNPEDENTYEFPVWIQVSVNSQ
jgi:hypothetical protein